MYDQQHSAPPGDGGSPPPGPAPGKHTQTSNDAPDPESAARDAVLRGVDPDVLGPLMIGLPKTTRYQLYAELWQSLPAASWVVDPLAIPANPPGKLYLDDLFKWAEAYGHAEVAHRCLEARYGLAPDSKSALTSSDVRDLYKRLGTLDPESAHALLAATGAIATPTKKKPTGHEQTKTPLEAVLHGLELLRAHIGTAVDLQKPNDAPNGPAALGMHTIRVQLSVPDGVAPLLAAQAKSEPTPLTTFLAAVQHHNASSPLAQAIKVDLILNPVMKEYGMAFAQFHEQHTVGVKGGEAPMTIIAEFDQKATYMLSRAAAARHKEAIASDKQLAPIAANLKAFVQSYPKLTKIDKLLGMTALQAEVVAATTKTAAAADAIDAQWNSTYQTVGHAFGEDCKKVLAALAPFDGVLGAIEIGNEPQAEWTAGPHFGFPGTKQGAADQTAQFIETTNAAMAVIHSAPSSGPTILEAPLEWDAGTENQTLVDIKNGAKTKSGQKQTYLTELMASSFHTRISSYVESWLAANPHAPRKVPISIHAYNSPEFDQALVQVLANIATAHRVTLELYVTEFQEDSDAGAQAPVPKGTKLTTAQEAKRSASQTEGVIAVGTAIELAVAQHTNLEIKSMLAWSYTYVGKQGKSYELDDDPSLKGLFG